MVLVKVRTSRHGCGQPWSAGTRRHVYGKLTEAHPDRIVVGDGGVFYLPEGTTCTYPLGTQLKVVYTEHDGRKHVENITRDHGIRGY